MRSIYSETGTEEIAECAFASVFAVLSHEVFLMKNEKRSVREIVLGFVNQILKDNVSSFAASSAFFIILSFIPFVLCLMAAIKYTPLSEDIVQNAILQVCPENLEGFITDIINQIYQRSSAVIPLSLVLAIWSAGKGIQSLINGLNVIYHVEETRNWLVTRLQAILYTIVLIISLLMSLVLLVFGNSLQRYLSIYIPALNNIRALIGSVRMLLVVVVLIVVFMVFYKALPNRKATCRSQIPGAIMTSLAWLIFSAGFSLYFSNDSTYTNMYGSMAGIMMVMIWLYICMNIVFYGALFNRYFERQIEEANEFARDFFEQEDETKNQLQEDIDDYFEND